MEKYYKVTVDITMTAEIIVKADSEQQARDKTIHWVADDPWHYARKANSCTDCNVVEAEETDERPEEDEDK